VIIREKNFKKRLEKGNLLSISSLPQVYLFSTSALPFVYLRGRERVEKR
jgi:hypothetical protein